MFKKVTIIAAALALSLTSAPVFAETIAAATTPTFASQCRKVPDADPTMGRDYNACMQTLVNDVQFLYGPSTEVLLCGQNDEAGTIYLGPNVALFGGDGSDGSLSSVACDALDSATETTADAPIFANLDFKVYGFMCKTSGTLGAGESIVFTLRNAAADTSPALTCTIGEAKTECRAIPTTAISVAAGTAIAMKAVETGDNADDDSWCRLIIGLK